MTTTAVGRRPARVARALAGALCAGVLLLSGCGSPDPGEPQDTGQQGPDPAGGGVQPASTAPAGELMDTAVENTDALMAELGGDWSFLSGDGPYETERVRAESSPQPCAIRSGDSGTTGGGMYSVVAVTGAPDENAGQSLERFEDALESAGYQLVEGNGVGAAGNVVANGESAQGRVTLTRNPEDLRIQLRTACSTDPSMQ